MLKTIFVAVVRFFGSGMFGGHSIIHEITTVAVCAAYWRAAALPQRSGAAAHHHMESHVGELGEPIEIHIIEY
jgi:hypothetical protein